MSIQMYDDSTEFENQYALVTGAARGIGLSIVRELLTKGIQKLAVIDKMVAQDSCRRLVTEFGKDRVIFIRCDVSIPAELENAFKVVSEQFPKLDIVINNAGILDDSAWEREIAINLSGTIRGTLFALSQMSKSEGKSGGTIINVSSLSGLKPWAGCPIHSAISASIIALTNAFSLPFHYSRTGVRLMNVCPGITYTKIISGASRKMLSEEIGKEWLKELATTSTQKPENVAKCVIHMLLCGRNGSTWISEGGMAAYEINPEEKPEIRSI